ncbi:MAG: organic solvent tolerance protein [Bdellovibrionales bacterium]|nr:organic solvent tolerance protein [Bdellovibrionales bacterium]
MIQRLIVIMTILMSAPVFAKDLTNRLGVGYSNHFSESLPSLSVSYYNSPDMAFSASIGVDTQENNSKFGFMARMKRIIFPENNLNFYMGAGAGILSYENNAGTTDSGFELNGFAGAEFFFSGLENLGFNFEFGIGVSSVSSQVRFYTLGQSPVHAGITFYF